MVVQNSEWGLAMIILVFIAVLAYVIRREIIWFQWDKVFQ